MQVTKIKFEKNYNGKLHCDYFYHIDLPPKKEITQKTADQTIVEISVEDESIKPQHFILEGWFELDLNKKIGNFFPYLSHAMTEDEFLTHVFSKYPKTMQNTTCLYCYLYKRFVNS